MISAPCGKVCEECPMFGGSCEGCAKEMSFSFAYHCQAYDRAGSEKGQQCTGQPCKAMDGKACLCPLVVEKSMRSGIKFGQGPDTPVQ